MKITIDLDMTPAELRDALGLPDVKSVQDRWVARLEESLNEEIAKMSPEALAEKWAGALIPNTDLLNVFMKMMPGVDTK
ncbi:MULTISPECIES: DUF6489 family protein [unclassified Ruegeria]|uniref:DUF6489 family protein n=1 Tax=unclassified Ruegeria TaxID=2625375 RepID=UPI001ADD558A|nr:MULTISPECIES: DUF6489 family protein [unclassified Ruegeria]MBO9412451.1 hypothetical protein [Ruegeria sp. R8_1]MBO9416311.1 hypothetical protein [Ruegeria sp. R8_2]